MREYLIKAADGSGWIPIHRDRLAEALTPRGLDARPVEGEGDFRICIDNCEIAISGEDPGWHINFEGDMDTGRAEAIVEQIRTQIEEVAGLPADVVPVSD